MFDLTGKTALVTGATGGIGGEIAKALHAAGATVVLSGTREAVLQDLVDYRTDVAVLAQFTEDPRFHAVPYSQHPIVIFVHRKHRFAGRRSIRMAELEDERPE